MSIQEQAPQPEAEANRIELIQQALALSEIAGPSGEQDEFVKSVLLANAENVKTEYTYSGGFTIPGTDEWIPDTKTPSYTLETTDDEGIVSSEQLPSTIAERLLSYKEQHAEVKPAEVSQEKTDTPVVPEVAAATPVEPAHAAKHRRRAERPQGPPSGVSAEAHGSTEPANSKGVSSEVKAAADLVGLDARNRGHRSDGKFLSKHEVELIAEHQNLIRSGIGKNVVKSPETTEPLITSVRPVSGTTSVTLPAIGETNNDSPEPAEIDAPIVDPSQAGMRKRLKGIMGRTAEKLGDFSHAFNARAYSGITESLSGFYGDEERGGRRKTMTKVVGALAIAGVAYLELKGLGASHHVKPGSGNQSGLGDFNAPPAPHKATQHTETLRKGHTIWNDVAKIGHDHHHELSQAEIKGAVDQILPDNHMTYEQARHMATGAHYNIPEHLYEELTKPK